MNHNHRSSSCAAALIGCACAAVFASSCGYGPGRQKGYAEEKQVADHADLAKPLDPTRVVGMGASVIGCLEKRSGELILTRNDAGVPVATTGGDPTGPRTLRKAQIRKSAARPIG